MPTNSSKKAPSPGVPREIVRGPCYPGSKDEPAYHVSHKATTGPMVSRLENEPKNQLAHVHVAILAGGSGTRLWPLSRETWPKQLLALTGKNTLLQETCRRTQPVVDPGRQMIITSHEYSQQVVGQVTEIFPENTPAVMAEPCGRNTAPAILWAALAAQKKSGPDTVLVVLPSDHLVTSEDEYHAQLETAIKIAQQGNLVTFGIKPTMPETGYGYIESGKPLAGGALALRSKDHPLHVKRFVEKPDLKKAEQYIAAGNYTWNSGMFAFHVPTLLEEIKQFCPDLAKAFSVLDPADVEGVKACFQNSPNISIDYAVMEKTGKAVVIPAHFGWSDVGSWKSLFDVSTKDASGNVIVGDHIAIDTKNCLIFGRQRTISTLGIKDLAVIDTPDALLVCPLEETQRVKEIVARLKTEHRPQYSEHTTVHRPWGTYTILEEGPRYKIKRIVVGQGKRLSLQRHAHRSEHWVVVSGTAEIRRGEEEIYLTENQSTFIPATFMHRLANPGRIPLQIIEIQSGSYLEEDDIERFADDWGRKIS